MTKKFFVLESAIPGPGKRSYGTELAALKATCELQSYKNEVILPFIWFEVEFHWVQPFIFYIC